MPRCLPFFRRLGIWILLILCLLGELIPRAQAEGYALEEVRTGIYRYYDDTHRSLVVVGESDILLVDTLNRSAAENLRDLLKDRFNKPIRYVVFSHNHSDHIYGGEVFSQPGTTFISQELAKQDIVTTRTRTVVPDLTFKDALNVDLGNHVVELRYHGPNDGRGSISVRVMPEKVVFVVDWIVLGRMPWQKLWSYDIQGVINSTREVQSLDYDVFVGGHGSTGTKADVTNYLRYMELLYAQVIDGIQSGKSLDLLKRDIRLDEYKRLPYYQEWLPLNVEGVYERLMEESGMGWRPDIH